MQLPSLRYERILWKKGHLNVAGADEVGRGAFAGPVLAGAVLFAPDQDFSLPEKITINDSKKLTQKQRKEASVWIKENCLAWGVGKASVGEINRLGVGKATQRAFRRALTILLKDYPELFVLVDAFYIPWTRGLTQSRQQAIKKGDSLSFSIAAASIVAKVERDQLMTGLAKRFPAYAWEKNKGYGTQAHRETLSQEGPSVYHRAAFIAGSLKAVTE